MSISYRILPGLAALLFFLKRFLPLSLLIFGFGAVANADYDCADSTKTLKITLAYSANQGASVTADWLEVREFYQRYGIEIGLIETVIDPETEKTVHSSSGDTHSYLVYAPNSGTGGVWNLSLRIPNEASFQSTVILIDQMGTRFTSDVRCEPLSP